MSGTVNGADLSLSRDQEKLLRNALASNPRGSPGNSASPKVNMGRRSQSNDDDPNDATNLYTSPSQEAPGSGNLDSFNESPFLDYELEDGTFDWDNSQDNLFGDLPGADPADTEHHDKRKASSDNDGADEGTNKRREGEEKTAKKPGRKPLTAEPTTKRKAQNRAAQRAFRERKERHLKDLETKVEDLEKASEATNHENGRLRAQVEKLNMELREYRKRVSLMNDRSSPPQTSTQVRNPRNSSDVQFAFPKFGDLPSSFISNGSMAKTSSTTPPTQLSTSGSNQSLPNMARNNSSGSPLSATSNGGNGGTFDSNSFASNNVTFGGNEFQDLTGLFSPSVLANASRTNSTDYLSFNGGKSASPSVRHDSTSTANGQTTMSKVQPNSSASITASPISSVSHGGLDSSSGTTPESSCDSPDNNRGIDSTLNTINEEMNAPLKPEAPVSVFKSPSAEINGIDWMAQQNGGQFDPVLFGDYRDPQDNILNNSYGDFFNDAFPSPQDFSSPYNTGEVSEVSQHQKRDLMKEIEVRQNGDPNNALSEDQPKETVDCGNLWTRVKSSEKYLSGENDMDDLCSQLKSKAKCSGGGAVIDKKDVDHILGPASTDNQDPIKMFS